MAQRGHNKQGRHNLRQVGLSYVLDGESGLSLCHHVYPGNVADAEEFPVALERIQRLLARHAIPPETVTLVFDKGTAALANTVLLKEAGLGWISALPWNQAPAEFRQRPVEALPACSSAQPGVQAAAEKLLVHGEEYLCVLKYSATFAAEQLHSLSASLSKVLAALKRLAVEMARPGNRLTAAGMRGEDPPLACQPPSSPAWSTIRLWTSPAEDAWCFRLITPRCRNCVTHRLGRTLLVTNRLDWTAEQVVAAYAGQQAIEQSFSGPQGRRLAELAAAVSLDRQQDPRARFLLPAGSLPAALRAPPSPGLLALDHHRRAAERVRANPAVRTLVSCPGRRSLSHRHRGLHPEPHPKRPGRNLGLATTR